MDPGLDNLGFAEYWDGEKRLVMHKITPMYRREPDGTNVALEFEERLAVEFARALCIRFDDVLSKASIIAVEQQMASSYKSKDKEGDSEYKSQAMQSLATVVMATALWSVFAVRYPNAVVVKITPQEWRRYYRINCKRYPTMSDKSYEQRKVMSGYFLRDYLPAQKWSEVVNEFKIRDLNRNGNYCGDNHDAVEASIIACYALRNYELLRSRREREALPKARQIKDLRPMVRVEVPFVAPVGIPVVDDDRRRKRISAKRLSKTKEKTKAAKTPRKYKESGRAKKG